MENIKDIPAFTDFSFYDFSDGVQVDNRTIKKWIDEVLVKLKTQEFTYIRSGNSMVIGFKLHESMEIIVIKKGYGKYYYNFKPHQP